MRKLVASVALALALGLLVPTSQAAPGADLVPTALAGPATAAAGSQIALSWTVANQGDVDALPNWVDSVFLSLDTQVSGGDIDLGSILRTQPLAPGGTYDVNTTMAVPQSVTPGLYNLILRTDRNAQVPEANDANNDRLAPQQIRITKPDLVPTDLGHPVLVGAGSPVALSWTVENRGDAAAQGATWQDVVFLSVDQQISGGDLQIGLANHSAPVPAGGSYSVSINPTLSALTPAGTYFVLVRVDNSSVLLDSDRSNNSLLSPQQLTVTTNKPDLVPTDLGHPVLVGAGSPVALSWTVENRGDAAAQGVWQDVVFLSTDQQVGGGDLQIGLANHSTPVPAGGSYAVSINPTLSSSTPPGTYFVLVRVDNSTVLLESDRNNNTLLSEQQLTVAKANLVPTSLAGPPLAAPGDHIPLTWSVENQGSDSASPNWVDAAYLSADDQLGAGDTSVAVVTHTQPLAAGSSYSVSANGTVPNSVSAGAYYLLLRVDDTFNVPEANEGDNVMVATDRIVIDRAPTASAGGPYEVVEGGAVQIAASGTDPDGDTLAYRWDLDDDGTFETDGQSASYSAAGADGPESESVSVRACDPHGLCDTASAVVAILNAAPSIEAGASANIDEGDSFTRAGTFADPGPDFWTATVDYGDGGGAEPLTLGPDKSFELSHVYGDNGSYTILVTIRDDDGGSANATVTVDVANVAPAVDAGPDAAIGQGATFAQSGSFVDPGADTWTARVSFGDGSVTQALVLNGKTFGLSHVYAAPGSYTVQVEVTDDDGGGGIDNVSVTVADRSPPMVTCGAPDALWHANNVAIACTATDSGSGLANSGDASFALLTEVTPDNETANASTGSRHVCDVAGNCADAGPIGGSKVDRKTPAITIATPSSGAAHVLNASVSSSFSCSDGGSGVASCSAPATINTASVGTKTFVVTATDAVGNTGSASVPYTVSYAIALTYDPTKATKTITLQLRDSSGTNVSSASIILAAESVDGTIPLTSAFTFVRKPPSYKLATPGGIPKGAHVLRFRAGLDPVLHTAAFTR